MKRMKNDNAPLFISFRWCSLTCLGYAIISVLIKEFVHYPFRIFLIWLLLKALFIITNLNYIKKCQEAEHKIWEQNITKNIGFDDIQKEYPTATLFKKLKDSFLLSNFVTVLFLLYEII